MSRIKFNVIADEKGEDENVKVLEEIEKIRKLVKKNRKQCKTGTEK